MSLRDEAIKAMCLGCDRESCRRDGGAALDGLLDWLRKKAAVDDGPNPSPFSAHVGPRCLNCGCPEATQAAWDDLEDGGGTNLCWGHCESIAGAGDGTIVNPQWLRLCDLLSEEER